MTACPLCSSMIEGDTCPVCGFVVGADADVTVVAPVDEGPDGGPDATALGATVLSPGQAADPGRSLLRPESERWDAPAPWDDPAGLYRSAPATPPPPPPGWGTQPAGWSEQPPAQGQPQPGYPMGPVPGAGYPPAAPVLASTAPRSRTPLVAGVLAVALIAAGVLLVPRLLGQAAPVATPTAPTAPVSTTPTATQSPVVASPPASVPAPAPAPQPGPAAGTTGYFTVLDSLKKDWFTASQARAFADEMQRNTGRSLTVVDSDVTGNMNPNYYVVGEGLNASKGAGDAVCTAWGRPAGEQGDDCYAKTITLSSTSILGPAVAESAEQGCQRVAPGSLGACTAANDFLLRFQAIEKTVSAADISNWLTDPAYFYSDTPRPAAAIQADMVKPTPPTSKYYPGHLLRFQPTGSGATVSWIVPFRKNGKLGIDEVTYVLVPGSGNPYRIAKVSDNVLVGPR